MADPVRRFQGDIDESFSARFGGDSDPFKALGLTMPSDAAKSGITVADPFSKLGLTLPSAPASPQTAAQTVQAQIERDMLPRPRSDAEIVASPKVSTPLERFGQEVLAIGGSVAKEAQHGAATFGAGVTNALQNRPADAAMQMGGGMLETLFSPLAAVKRIATQMTGNKDFGEKAALIVPGRAAAGTLAKAIPEVNALQTLVKDIPAKDLSGVIGRLETNPTLSVMDIAPNVQSKAMGISTGEPSKGAAHLFETSARRADEAAPRLQKAFDEAMGPVPDTVRLLDQFKADVRKVGKEQIEPVLQKTAPVDITPVVQMIDDKIGARALKALQEGKATPLDLTPTQQRLWNVRQDLVYRGADGKPQIKDQYFLDPTGKPGSTALDAGAHGIQSTIRREADALMRSGEGDKRLLGSELNHVRQALVEQIDKAGTRGEYRGALSKYRDEAQVQEAFDMGQTILSKATAGEKGTANRPEAWRAWAESATEKELAAARLGARTAVDNAMGHARNEAAAGRGIPDVRFVRDKMEILFGEKNANKIIAEAEAEAAKAHTNSLLTANSKTARSRAAQEAIAPREVGNVLQLGQSAAPIVVAEGANALLGGGLATGLPAAAVITAGLARKGAQVAGRAHDVAKNDAYAIWASATDPNIREPLLNALRSRQAKISGGDKVTNALASPFRAMLPQ